MMVLNRTAAAYPTTTPSLPSLPSSLLSQPSRPVCACTHKFPVLRNRSRPALCLLLPAAGILTPLLQEGAEEPKLKAVQPDQQALGRGHAGGSSRSPPHPHYACDWQVCP